MAQRGRRTTGVLARLEQQLADLNAQRHRVISEIKAAADHLTRGLPAPMTGPAAVGNIKSIRIGRPATSKSGRKRQQLSAEARAKMSASTKARWAKAKKAGKTSLG
jgi:hypothetical protein